MIVVDAGNEFRVLADRLYSDFDEFEAVPRREERRPGKNAASGSLGVDGGAVAR
jgi:hypothetical protein